MTNDYLLGFDIGGTKCAVVLGQTTDEGVQILDRIAFPTDTPHGPESALLRLEDGARELARRHGVVLSQVRGLGISCGCPLDSTRGIIQSPPNLPGWDDIPVTQYFEERLSIPARLQNDANACALAEWRWGAGRGTRHMIFLTFGTGFGAGLILNGALYAGSCEGFCSGGGIARLGQQIVRRYRRRGTQVAFCRTNAELAQLSAKDVFDAARNGDPVALEIVDIVGRQFGRSLAMLMDLFNPEMIVAGSIFVRARDLIWPAAERVIATEALPQTAAACRVVPAVLGEALGDYASLATAAEASEMAVESA